MFPSIILNALENGDFNRCITMIKQAKDNPCQEENAIPLSDFVFAVVQNGNLGLLEELDECFDIDFYIRNNEGKCPIHVAAQFDHYNMLNYIKNKAEDTFAKLDFNENTILHVLAQNQSLFTLRQLVRYHHDEIISMINSTNRKGDTALHLACSENNTQLAMELLRMNADPEISNRNNVSVTQIQPHLINNFTYITNYPVHTALKNSADLQGLLFQMPQQKIIEAINIPDHFGNTLLHLAVERESIPMIQYLLNIGNPALTLKNYAEKTPMQMSNNKEIRAIFNDIKYEKIYDKMICAVTSPLTTAVVSNLAVGAGGATINWYLNRNKPEQNESESSPPTVERGSAMQTIATFAGAEIAKAVISKTISDNTCIIS